MNMNDYLISRGRQNEEISGRVDALEAAVTGNTQDINDLNDAVAELGELIGGETNG